MQVLTGKDRGKTGKVIRMFPGVSRALVEKINLSKHFERRTQENQTGGIIERESPVALAKLAPQCPKCKKASRIGYSLTQDGKKRRFCKRCNEPL